MCYELYVRPHLDYGDVIYPNQRVDLMKLVVEVQYKAGLIVSGCWQGTNRNKLNEELRWESLSDRRWFHRLTVFCKSPSYLSDYLPTRSETSISLRRHI